MLNPYRPTERLTDSSAPASIAPTLPQLSMRDAVLFSIMPKHTSSETSNMFLALMTSSTCPSASFAAASVTALISSRLPQDCIRPSALASMKSPTSTVALLPQTTFEAVFPRLSLASSTTSSCSRVAV